MSERIVNDPSLHGWTEENGKWVWDGTDSGAGMIISETEPDAVDGTQWLNALTGEVFIYDDGKWLEFPGGKDGAAGADGKQIWSEVAPDGDIYYDKGNVGIGTDSPSAPLDVRCNAAEGKIAEFHQNAGYGLNIEANQWDAYITSEFNQSLKFRTSTVAGNPQDRLTIDASGDATFSGTVSANDFSAYSFKRPNSSYGVAIDSTGTFRPLANGTMDLGLVRADASDYKFKDGWFTGTVNSNFLRSQRVIQDGSPVIDAKGLIKTLSTLRQATMDDTQDIRESLRSAIDELIDGFEQEIATMPAEEES